MTKTMTADLGTLMLNQTKLILQMTDRSLSLNWLKEFDEECLLACCQRIRGQSISGVNEYNNLQRELIRNPGFAAFYADCLSQFADNEQDQPTGPAQYTMTRRLDEFLPLCWEKEKDVTRYCSTALLDAMAENDATDYGRIVFLENFSHARLTAEERHDLFLSIGRCHDIPLCLDKKQRALLREPFMRHSELAVSDSFPNVSQLLNDHPALLNLARAMYEKGAGGSLCCSDYQRFALSETEYCSLLNTILQAMDQQGIDLFLLHWQENDCPLHELQSMARQLQGDEKCNWTKLLETRSGYTNTLYGTKFKNLDLSDVDRVQDDILMYAISQRKKHFIQMADENVEVFMELPDNSLLFCDEFYKEHFNINELTPKGLASFAEMPSRKRSSFGFAAGRQYTFPEIRALYGLPDIYWTLYNTLGQESQDERLQVFREIKKRELLSYINIEDIPALAVRLSERPLSCWRQNEFGHIKDLRPGDAVQLLVHFDKCSHLLLDMRNRQDARLALHNRDSLTRFDSIQSLKDSLMDVDPKWRELSDRLKLAQEFPAKYEGPILDFLCQNGAEIALTYMDGLESKYRPAFQRVVKAQLMGKFYDLKYFEGDLNRELGISLEDKLVEIWKKNTWLASRDVSVQEHDDFFSTMLAGVKPKRTCLSYQNGAYRDCLLAGFDSNKKLLYARAGGRTVGRAYLRFTKAKLGEAPSDMEGSGKLTFADLETVQSPGKLHTEPELLAIFLERPYTGHADPALETSIMRQFVRLAAKKADEMGVMLVLSSDYAAVAAKDFPLTRLKLYISRSKAGQQYLDSLGGSASTSSEGSYRDNAFLVRRPYGES